MKKNKLDLDIKWEGELPAERKLLKVHGEETEKTMSLAVELLRGTVQGNTPEGATRVLRNSVLGETRRTADHILGSVRTPVPYALPVETGSRPHWAPLEPLKYWVRRKLAVKGSYIQLSAAADVRSLRRAGIRGVQKRDVMEGRIEDVARQIQYKIARYGTKGHRMFRRAFDEQRDTVLSMFEACRDKIVERWAKL